MRIFRSMVALALLAVGVGCGETKASDSSPEEAGPRPDGVAPEAEGAGDVGSDGDDGADTVDSSAGEAEVADRQDIEAAGLDSTRVDDVSVPDTAAGDDAGVPDPVDAAGPFVSGTVVVDRTTGVGTISPGFVGLSYEKAHLAQAFFTGTNRALLAMFGLLGPSVLRIGGNTVDQITWTPAGVGHTAGQTAKTDIDALAAFVKAAGWTVIYGVNMKTSNATIAADEAAYAASALGSRLYGFELGNEVDLYPSTAMETTWSYANFKIEWEAFAAAIRARVPNAPLTGPASANINGLRNYGVPFARDEAAKINLLTQHYYRGNGQSATSTIDLLLAPDPGLLTMLTTLATAVTANHIPASRMAETNSFYNGGANGVSDSFGTALWAIDFLFTNARNGSSGVNFHGGDNTPGYTPIADANGTVLEARPDFYGLLLFTLAGPGTLYDARVAVANVSLSAYAIGASSGSTSVILVNKDHTTGVRARLDLGKPAAAAHLVRLTAPALNATSGVTLANASIAPSGAWSPGPLPTALVTGSTLDVLVPAASAVLVRVP